MKLSMDDLMRYAPSRDIPVEPLSSDETERIRVMTMKKNTEARKNRTKASPCGPDCRIRCGDPLRLGLCSL